MSATTRIDCSGAPQAVPQYFHFAAAYCNTSGVGGYLNGDAAAMRCLATQIKATQVSSTYACTVAAVGDTVSTPQAGRYFLNAYGFPGCDANGNNCGARVDYVILRDAAGSANGGCSASSYGGVSTWFCNVSALRYCEYSGGTSGIACSFSYRREPDVSSVVSEIVNAENYGLVFGFALLFVIGFAWAWRLTASHGGHDA